MKINGGHLAAEVNAEDIQHLMSSGSTQVACESGDMELTLRCRQSLSFEVKEPEADDG